MIKIFTSLKTGDGRVAEIQQRALENWREGFDGAEIVDVGKNLRFDKIVGQGQLEDICAWINSDIFFGKSKLVSEEKSQEWEMGVGERKDGSLNEVVCAFRKVVRIYGECLMVGQRIDVLPNGSQKLHNPSGVDYFFFRQGMFLDLPITIMGRGYCDSALIAYCLRRKIPVIDATTVIKAFHQWHDYGHIDGGKKNAYEGEEAKINMQANGLRRFAPHIADANYKLVVCENKFVVRRKKNNWMRRCEWFGFYEHGWSWFPNFNRFWNIIHRGGKW